MAGDYAALIIWYDEPPELVRAGVDSLLGQDPPPVEVLLFGDGPSALLEALERPGAPVRGIGECRNEGYFAGISKAVNLIDTEYLLVLNPDARAQPGCLQRLLEVADSDPSVAIAGAQIMLGDGRLVNAGDNPIHPSGISVSGRYGEPPEAGAPRDVAVSSGACWLVRRSAFLELGGLVDEQFLYYHEDVDLAWRALIGGRRVVFVPAAIAHHSYEFSRRPQKWFLLERNRLFSVLANYEARTLALLAPLLVAVELGVVLGAVAGGWLPAKLRAYAGLWVMRSQIRAQRRLVAGIRQSSDSEVLALFVDRLQSPLLPRRATDLMNLLGVPYLRLVRRLLR